MRVELIGDLWTHGTRMISGHVGKIRDEGGTGRWCLKDRVMALFVAGTGRKLQARNGLGHANEPLETSPNRCLAA